MPATLEALPTTLERFAKPQTWNSKDRTALVVMTSNVRQQDGYILDHSDSAIVRPKRPLPAVLDHISSSAAVFGSVQDMTRETGEDGVERLVGLLKIDGNPRAVEDAMPMIENGTARFSIRAKILEAVPEDGKTVRVTRWEPTHLALAVDPMDSDAILRSVSASREAMAQSQTLTEPAQQEAPAEAVERAETQGEPTTESDAAEDAAEQVTRAIPARARKPKSKRPASQSPDTGEEDSAEVERAEIARQNAIMRSCIAAGKSDLAQDYIDRKVPHEAVMEDLLKKLAGNGHAAAPAVQPSIVTDQKDKLDRAIVDAIDHRVGNINQPTEFGRRFVGASIAEISRAYLDGCGVDTRGMDNRDVIDAAFFNRGGMVIDRAFHGTSHLPAVVSDAAHKRMMSGWDDEPATWAPFSVREDAVNFKNHSAIYLDGRMKMKQTLESGEYVSMKLEDGSATYSLTEYTGKVLLSRKALIDDDLRILNQVPSLIGAEARALQADLVYSELTGYNYETANRDSANGGLAGIDGVALFDNTHSNTGTGALSIANIGDLRTLMRLQTTPAGRLTNLDARYLLVPAAIETEALQLVRGNNLNYSPANATGANGPNIFSTLEVISDARLDSASSAEYYLCTATGRARPVQYGYLSGTNGPELVQREVRDPDGIEMLARMDFYAHIPDFRPWVRSSGV